MSNNKIAGRYQKLEVIGSGGMGTVYKGQDLQTQEFVAIKHLKPEAIADDPSLIERFKREGAALRQLNHPNIVKRLAAVEQDHQYYLIMEFTEGGDLNRLLKRERLPTHRTIEIALDLADALTRAHRLNIIHRDLKPANVLIAADGTPRLTDFGVAYIGNQERITASGVAVGTIDYLSPEVLSGETVSTHSDIWSFGVMLFELVAGRRPFTGDTITRVILAIMNEPVPDLEMLCSEDVPIALIDLIYRMLEKDPRVRISSVRQVGLELESILRGESVRSHVTQNFYEEKLFATPTPSAHRHNLPAQTTPFVGRETEQTELARLLGTPSARLITILAPGGMGKTRLALEVAQKQLEHFGDGVFLVELAPLSAVDSIVPALAAAVSYQFQPDERESRQQLLDYFREKSLLLVLDNFEHLMDGAQIVTDILNAAPRVQIITTSRQRLNQTGETVYNIEGMDFPDWGTPETALEYGAVKLFLQSARRVHSGFELHADNLPYVAQICRLVQGMPLGILLAASWLELLSAREIASEIERSLDFLESALTDLPTRQRSLRAVFDYSWNLMTEPEQQVFMKLSVFRGGFTRAAGEAVAGANLRLLMSLVNKSLLRRDPDSGRYDLHELLQQYAEQRLIESNELAAVREAHSTYFIQFMSQRLPDIKGHRQIPALDEIEADFANVRIVWEYIVSQKNSVAVRQLMGCLSLFCDMRGTAEVGADLFRSAVKAFRSLSNEQANTVIGWLQAHYAMFLLWSGVRHYTDEIAKHFEISLAIARSNQDQAEIAFSLWLIGVSRSRPDANSSSLPYYEESLQHYRELNDLFYVGRLLGAIAVCYEGETRRRYIQESLNLQREIGDDLGRVESLGGLAWMHFFDGNLDEADRMGQELLGIMREKRDLGGIATFTVHRTLVAFSRGSFEEVMVLNGETLKSATTVNDEWAKAFSLAIQSFLASILDEDFSRAKQACDGALRLNQKIMLSHQYIIYMASAVAAYGLGDYETARKHYREAFNQRRGSWFELIPAVYLSAFLHHQQGRSERAVEFLSLVNRHPRIPEGWRNGWALPNRLCAELASELGAEAYQAAWERGKTLEVEIVVRELL